MYSVIIIQEHLPHYRISFFEELRKILSDEGVCLSVIHGNVVARQYVAEKLSWSTAVGMLNFGGFRFHRNSIQAGLNCDLLISPQEVKYILPFLLQISSKIGGPKFAFWGHGKNFQASSRSNFTERVKRILSRRCDWWFAYNDLSAEVVRDLGYPAERITTVGNAIDTTSLAKQRESNTDAERTAVRSELGITSTNVAVYTGGLYPIKRIGFLIVAAKRIRERIPDFELIVIGDGPDRRIVSEAASGNRWIHDVGSKNDRDKVPYWMISKVLLMPGGVGLVILDSFALGVPMVTTDTRLHGPEIDYLKNNENGLLVSCGDSTETYALAVVELLSDSERLGRLRCGTLASAQQHTVEDMVDNFAGGIMDALKSPKYRRSSR